MTEGEDVKAYSIALANWMDSQGADMDVAICALAKTLGAIIGHMAPNMSEVVKGVMLASDVVTGAAVSTFMRK